mmetsp:Transcript_61169/g.173751  ORF Transcript_61169/g.173751 Transcript_61169/m.173751 type:complete len:261 (+) Transcript_61169:572-1354(+)
MLASQPGIAGGVEGLGILRRKGLGHFRRCSLSCRSGHRRRTLAHDPAPLPCSRPQLRPTARPRGLAHGAVGSALRVPGLHAAELQHQPWEEQAELKHSTDAGEARGGGNKHPYLTSDALALLHAVGKAVLMHHIAQFVEDLELGTDGTVDVGVHRQRHGPEPAFLPHAQPLEAVLAQHPALERLRGGSIWPGHSWPLEHELREGKDAALLRRARRLGPATCLGKNGSGTGQEVPVWGPDTSPVQDEARADRAQVVDPHVP